MESNEVTWCLTRENSYFELLGWFVAKYFIWLIGYIAICLWLCISPGGGGVLPMWWVIHMCRGFDPLFSLWQDRARSFWGIFILSTNTKTIFCGIKTTNSYRIRSFRPQISFFPRSFWVQFSAASGTPPSFFGPSTPPPPPGCIIHAGFTMTAVCWSVCSSVWSKLVSALLTHWGRVTHIWVGNLTIIGPDNGLSPDRRQAIIWTNADILLIGPLGTNFSEVSIEIQTFSFKRNHLKVSSAKWRPFCLGFNVLTLAKLCCIELKLCAILHIPVLRH